MNNDEFAAIVEWEGWLYALTEVKASELKDSAASEALEGVQEAFRALISAVPDLEVDPDFLDAQLELNFG